MKITTEEFKKVIQSNLPKYEREFLKEPYISSGEWECVDISKSDSQNEKRIRFVFNKHLKIRKDTLSYADPYNDGNFLEVYFDYHADATVQLVIVGRVTNTSAHALITSNQSKILNYRQAVSDIFGADKPLLAKTEKACINYLEKNYSIYQFLDSIGCYEEEFMYDNTIHIEFDK